MMKFNEPIGYKNNAAVRVTLADIREHSFHLHEDAVELILLLSGRLTISDCASDYVLSAGDLYIFNPRDPHRIYGDKNANITLTVHMSRSYYQQFFPDLYAIYFVCDSFLHRENDVPDLSHLRFLTAMLYRTYFEEPVAAYRVEAATCELLRLLILQFRYYTYQKSPTDSLKIVRRIDIKTEDPTFRRIYRIIDRIYSNFHQKLKLADIAATEFLSMEHLSRTIHQTCGLTFSELLSLARCEEAERLLCTTNKTVDQIATEVGFSNRKHLAVQFHRWYRKTPTAFRKSILTDQKRLPEKVSRLVTHLDAAKPIERCLDGVEFTK